MTVGLILITLPLTGETDRESGDSEGSDSEDDFVVVIPDCFNLDIPLTSHSAPHSMTHSRHDFVLTGTSPDPAPTTAAAAGDVMARSSDSTPVPVPSQPPVPHVDPGQQTPPTAAVPNKPKTTGASPQTERRQFVPSRVTLRGVKDARLRNPLTMATGLVNTVTDLVEGLTLAGKKREGRKGEEGGQQHSHPPPVPDEEEEEIFVVSSSFCVGSWGERHERSCIGASWQNGRMSNSRRELATKSNMVPAHLNFSLLR